MKNKSENVVNAVKKATEIEQVIHSELKVAEFVNSRGMAMTLRGIPPYLVQMATESIKRPQPPTYKVQRADDGFDEFPHTEETIADPATTDEEKEQWNKYLAETQLANIQASDILLNVVLMEGVDLHTGPEEMAKWERKMKIMNISIPDDDMEKELMYKKSYSFSTQDDAQILMTKVLELTGISREEVDLAKNSFPDKVESKA